MGNLFNVLYRKYPIYSRPEIEKFIARPADEAINRRNSSETFIIGVQGGNGSGKSKLSRCMRDYLQIKGYRAVTFSSDDFYETRENRVKLKSAYPNNPFYDYSIIPRGMPGTHRIKEMKKVLVAAKDGEDFEIPVFDKTLYDGKGEVTAETVKVKGRQDFVIAEGIFWGMPYLPASEMERSCSRNNVDLRSLDPNLDYYPIILELFKANRYDELPKNDYTIMMRPISLDLHKKWRWTQEQENLKNGRGGGMIKEQVEDFVQRYLPLLAYCYDNIKADFTILIDEDHRFHSSV